MKLFLRAPRVSLRKRTILSTPKGSLYKSFSQFLLNKNTINAFKYTKLTFLFSIITGYLKKKEKQFLENWKWNLPYFAASIKWNKQLPWWLSGRVCLPMQGTRVWALIREDPTCCGATKSVHHNYRACALEPGSRNYGAHTGQLLEPAGLEPCPQQ